MDDSDLPRPDEWLAAVAAAFPPRLHGPALDVACGRGRNSLWLAARGVEVVGVDASDEAISYATRLSVATGAGARFLARDLEKEGLPPGRWGAILVFNYLDRGLFGALESSLAPGGLLAYKTHLGHRLRGPDARPRRKAYLLEPGELLGAFPALAILDYREWAEQGRGYAALLARRPGGPDEPAGT